jgi:hypothetical protein
VSTPETINATTEELSQHLEYWIPVVRYNSGSGWFSSSMHRTKIDAEVAIQGYTDIKEAKLVRVILPR